MRLIVAIALFSIGCHAPTLEERAASGEEEAIFELAALSFVGAEGYTKDQERSVNLLSPLADSGNLQAIYQLGMIAYIRSDMNEARRLFSEAADQEYVPAYVWAAHLHMGLGCSAGGETAFRFMEAGADSKDERSITSLNATIAGLIKAREDGSLNSEFAECYDIAVRRGHI